MATKAPLQSSATATSAAPSPAHVPFRFTPIADPLALARLGWHALKSGHHRAAVAALEEAVIAEPNRAELQFAYGIALAKSGQTDSALEVLARGLQLEPSSVEVWCIVAELSLDRLDYAAAAVALQKCLTLDPRAEHPSGRRARALVKKGEKLLAQAVPK